jgi:predicted ATP-grasp superfamily ATP-dependent carboligase
LAAARDLGARGVAVALALDTWIAPVRWSCHVNRIVRFPGKRDPGRLLEWLSDFGRRCPGHVLYPTSDELAWVLSANKEILSRWFRLYSPSPQALVSLLDKVRLTHAAEAVGLRAPLSWCPADELEVSQLSRDLRLPVFVKPRVHFAGLPFKVIRVDVAEDLVPVWRTFQREARYPDFLRSHVPGLERPLVQLSHGRTHRVFTVDGFVDDSGELYSTRGCVKVLQMPRGSGPGVCFEAAPVPAPIEEGLRKLFVQNGFFGVFDAEFIEHEGQHLLIDVNPRFYNHMAFEIERGLPLPWLAYLAAIPDRRKLIAAIDDSKRDVGSARAYIHRFPTRALLTVQRLAGGMSRQEHQDWIRWLASHNGHVVDPIRSSEDPGPGVAEIAFELTQMLRHPRAYFRMLADRGPH